MTPRKIVWIVMIENYPFAFEKEEDALELLKKHNERNDKDRSLQKLKTENKKIFRWASISYIIVHSIQKLRIN